MLISLFTGHVLFMMPSARAGRLPPTAAGVHVPALSDHSCCLLYVTCMFSLRVTVASPGSAHSALLLFGASLSGPACSFCLGDCPYVAVLGCSLPYLISIHGLVRYSLSFRFAVCHVHVICIRFMPVRTVCTVKVAQDACFAKSCTGHALLGQSQRACSD